MTASAERGESVLDRAREAMDQLTPHSDEAEQMVLGSLLLAPESYEAVADLLRDSDFFKLAHRLIYRVTAQLIEDGKPVDPLLVSDVLRSRGELDQAGGLQYVGGLTIPVFNVRAIRGHAENVRKLARLRELLAMAHGVNEAARARDADPDSVLAIIERDLQRMRECAVDSDLRRIDEVLNEAVEHIDTMYQKEGEKLAGFSTGLVDLDAMTGGFEPGDLIVVGARPSMGKTSLVLGITEHVARLKKGAVAFFSLEMSGKQLGLRQISAAAKISMHELRTGDIAESDWSAIVQGVGRLHDLPIYIDDRPGVSISYIRARCKRLARRSDGLALICVDYLTLMDGQGESRDERVGAIAKGLKRLAKEFACPVIALAQLNRSCEQRTDKRPMLSDLRESGEVEQAADVILFLYREEVYNKDTVDWKGVAEIIVGKQRNGPTGTVYATFLGKSMSFVNIDPSWRSPTPARQLARPKVRNLSDFKSRASGDREEMPI